MRKFAIAVLTTTTFLLSVPPAPALAISMTDILVTSATGETVHRCLVATPSGNVKLITPKACAHTRH